MDMRRPQDYFFQRIWSLLRASELAALADQKTDE
jgi:hypothetical protein